MDYKLLNDAAPYLVHLAQALAAAGAVSWLGFAIKKWHNVQSERVMISIIIGLSAIAPVANYLLHVPTTDPGIIAMQTAIIGFMTQPFYFMVVKPVVAALLREAEKAAQLNNEIKSAAIPAGGLDFSN